MNYRTLLLFLLTFALVACAGESGMDKYSTEASYAPTEDADEYRDDGGSNLDQEAPIPTTTGQSFPSPQAAQKIIYTANVRARVAQLDTALARITRQITASGGFISSQHRNNSNYEHSAALTIRLPAGQLNSTLGYLPEIAEQIDHQNLDSRNVTAQWLDLESRLQTKRDVRDRYVEILRNRAQKVEDILNAEDKIRVITEEIEAKEGQLRYLRDQVSLSTLELNLYETIEYRDTGVTYTRSFGSKLGDSLATGWELVQELILGLVAIWPLLLITPLFIWLFRRWRKKYRANRS